MQDEAEQMSFQEFEFMKDEFSQDMEKEFKFELHRQQFDNTYKSIVEGEKLLEELDSLDRQKDELLQKREQKIREIDSIQRKISELESVLVQVGN